MTGSSKLVKYTWGDYAGRNTQSCLSKETKNEMKSLNFLSEPYAWLLGKTFSLMLKKSLLFEILLDEHIRELNIDFDQPIVG